MVFVTNVSDIIRRRRALLSATHIRINQYFYLRCRRRHCISLPPHSRSHFIALFVMLIANNSKICLLPFFTCFSLTENSNPVERFFFIAFIEWIRRNFFIYTNNEKRAVFVAFSRSPCSLWNVQAKKSNPEWLAFLLIHTHISFSEHTNGTQLPNQK